MPPEVAAVFATFPVAPRARLMAVRALILEMAAATPGVGPIKEALRWGEPAYLTTRSKSGTTIRLNAVGPDGYALYFNCKTSLLDTFRGLYPGLMRFEGDRAIRFETGEAPPTEALAHCIALALTYHRARKRA